MVKVVAQNQPIPLTFSTLFCLLKALSPDIMHSQVSLFTTIFASYCQALSTNADYAWEPAHATVNQIFGGARRPSWYIFRYYYQPFEYERLKNDAKYYAHLAAPTAKLLASHIDQLTALVTNAPNINPDDKDDILQYCNDTSADDLGELLFRILRLLFTDR